MSQEDGSRQSFQRGLFTTGVSLPGSKPSARNRTSSWFEMRNSALLPRPVFVRCATIRPVRQCILTVSDDSLSMRPSSRVV